MRGRRIFVISVISIFGMYAACCSELLNLEDMAQDYVIGVKQIKLSQYPYAFNPSIVRWRGKLVVSFRVLQNPSYAQPFNSDIGIVFLDDEFEVVGDPYILPLRRPESSVPNRAEDGRLIVCNDRLYCVYSDCEEERVTRGGFRVYIAELSFENDRWHVDAERITWFTGMSENRREKNWVPFVYNDTLLLAYSIDPHLIVQPERGTNSAYEVAYSSHQLPWNFGEIRGGTPAVRDGDEYLAFFHSAQRMATIHSHGENLMHYFMGAYKFSAEPPFNITRMSAQPIIGKQFYRGAEYTPYPRWRKKYVVFPCGIMIDGDYVIVLYGRNDHEMWIAVLDKKQLYANMGEAI